MKKYSESFQSLIEEKIDKNDFGQIIFSIIILKDILIQTMFF